MKTNIISNIVVITSIAVLMNIFFGTIQQSDLLGFAVF